MKGGSQMDKKVMFFDGKGKPISAEERNEMARENAKKMQEAKDKFLADIEEKERKRIERNNKPRAHTLPGFKLRPTGFTVLVELLPVQPKSKKLSDILDVPVDEKELEKEEAGQDMGRVVSWGCLAFVGYGVPDRMTMSAEDWGIKVGDLVEFRRYDGKITRMYELDEDYQHYRWINDKDIIGVIENYGEKN